MGRYGTQVTRWHVGWGLTAMCLGGQLLVLFLRPTPWAEKGTGSSWWTSSGWHLFLTPGRISSPLQGVISCLRLLTTSNLLLLSFVFLFSGLETSFWAGAFPSSVSFTLQLASRKMVRQDGLFSDYQNQVMGLCSVMVPVGSIFRGGALILFKSFVNRVGRSPVVCTGQICTSSPLNIVGSSIKSFFHNCAPLHYGFSYHFLGNGTFFLKLILLGKIQLVPQLPLRGHCKLSEIIKTQENVKGESNMWKKVKLNEQGTPNISSEITLSFENGSESSQFGQILKSELY